MANGPLTSCAGITPAIEVRNGASSTVGVELSTRTVEALELRHNLSSYF